MSFYFSKKTKIIILAAILLVGALVFSVVKFGLIKDYFQHSGEQIAGKPSIKILSRGAPVVSAEKIRDDLKSNGFGKPAISQDKGDDFEHTLIVFREESFKVDALNVRELLIEKEQIYSEARIAATDEEKSADVVIMLGKSKSAPPN